MVFEGVLVCDGVMVLEAVPVCVMVLEDVRV
jgi:hypothetical protein